MSKPSVKVGASVAAALLVSLLGWEAGGRYMNRPQPVIENRTDSQWCAGITGIPKQDYYTDAECDAYTAGHLHRDVSALERCMPLSKMPERIQFASRHMAYNTGPALVCKSTMAKHWRAGDYSPASCAVILQYTVVAGQDCRSTGKRCRGLVLRREYEHATCTGAIDWRLQRWEYRP
jgi:GH24 family phage-related lysozyme (muramidase)